MASTVVSENRPVSPFKKWLFEGQQAENIGPYEEETNAEHHAHSWWKVMCLTGVDYFSTLGYQPGIAAVAAGALSPVATLILVLLTLFGAYPIYSRVAEESPHGEGSISMLEHRLSWWQSKIFVLCLLGFVATDFVITITLSAADATAHLIENPYLHRYLEGQAIPMTLVLIAALGGLFLKGFKEAIGIAVVLVGTYLVLNAVVVVKGVSTVLANPQELNHWKEALSQTHGGNPLMLLGVSLLLFPKLALGLSGFETGVAVMPLVKGSPSDTEKQPKGRIRHTRRLLISAALIMSVFLILSSFVTTLHIPAAEFREATATSPAGKANGRALAYLAHMFFGDAFGTLYDASTFFILWFAGASAMAGLLNIVPRYLPRYGMAPEWTRAFRPLVLVFTAISFVVTLIFKADVVAQGGAYATGVLVLMTSAAVAVTISTYQKGRKTAMYAFGLIAAVFAYTTVVNIVERPDGIKIAAFFIGTIILLSLISRVWRTLELRVDRVELDVTAMRFVLEAAEGDDLIRIIPNHPENRDASEYAREDYEARRDHQIPPSERILFLEVDVPDSSVFSSVLRVKGINVGGYRVLRAEGPAIPNAIAAFLIDVQRITGKRPHAYFSWGESSPMLYLMKYILSGKGDIAPVTREILRRLITNPEERPVVHAAS